MPIHAASKNPTARAFARPALALGALLGALLCVGAVYADAARPAGPPKITRALIVSIDGLRPDVLLRADAPALHGLMARGSFTMWAVTTSLSVTLPSHTSMLTGVPPSKHGVVWNTDLPITRQVFPAYPTLFELAKRSGLVTAMAAGKSKFATLQKPGTLDLASVPRDDAFADSAVADTAAGWIRSRAPQVLFVHFPDVDLTGHDLGWGSSAQLAAVANVDRCVGRLLAALDEKGLRDSTLVLVTSDHGGAGKTHGPNDARSRHIPWIVSGPGIRRDLDLTAYANLTVRTEDTFATVCFVLGITPPRPVDGRPVMQIFENADIHRALR